MPEFAVLTGDIVDSSSLGAAALDASMAALRDAAGALRGWPPGMAAHFARRGGDGWQVALDRPALAFRAALYLQAVLRREDADRATRIALATGTGQLRGGDLNAASGAAFTASGRLLDAIPRHALMAHAAGGAAAAALRLADHLAQQWTQAQARALCELLPPDPGPRSDAAERLGITRQAVDQALWAAGYPALIEALGYLEVSE